MDYLNRQMEDAILRASRSFPVVMVCGQRQTGKSTMLKYLAEDDRNYVSLDDVKARNLANNDPELFLRYMDIDWLLMNSKEYLQFY